MNESRGDSQNGDMPVIARTGSRRATVVSRGSVLYKRASVLFSPTNQPGYEARICEDQSGPEFVSEGKQPPETVSVSTAGNPTALHRFLFSEVEQIPFHAHSGMGLHRIDLTDEHLKDMIIVRSKTPYERVDLYSDSLPLLGFRKAFLRIHRALAQSCRLITSSRMFELFIVLVILWNTVVMALENPTVAIQPSVFLWMDASALYIYTFEMALRVTSYIDPWNVLDCLVVAAGWFDVKYSMQGVHLSFLRLFRVLRPLRSITHIQGMKVIFQSLVGSLRLLLSSMALLAFFFLVAAIAALQLFMGVLRYRCMDIATGQIATRDTDICGYRECPAGQVCVRGLDNPIFGVVHFDNLPVATITIFQCVTMEGWIPVMNALQRSMGLYVSLFFIPVVFLGAFFFMNLTLIALKASVSPT